MEYPSARERGSDSAERTRSNAYYIVVEFK
jgi:hypothetical protein